MAKEFFHILVILISFVQIEAFDGNLSGLETKCKIGNSSICIKAEFLKLIDILDRKNFKIDLFNGITLVKDSHINDVNVWKELSKKFPRPDDLEFQINNMLAKKLIQLILSPSVKIKFLSSKESENVTGRDGGGGGGKHDKKGGGDMEQLASAAMMMKGTLLTLTMGAIAAIAGKALVAGLMALTLSAIVGLKSLTSSGHKKTTYEIVPKPVYTHSQSASSSHESHGGHASQFYYRSFVPQ